MNQKQSFTEHEQGLFHLKNGLVICDETQSKRFERIVAATPEKSNRSFEGRSWDEYGLACLFAECYESDTKYCPEKKTWFVFNSGRWQQDPGNLIDARLQEFYQLVTLYCAYQIEDENQRKSYSTFILKMSDRRFRDRIKRDAEAIEILTIRVAEFDANPYLINCKNGTFDLKTKCFYEQRADDLLTMQAEVEYGLQSYRYDRWDAFIDEVTEGNTEKAEYLQKALGYSIMGTPNEECMFILHGKTTRNGKSTLLDAVQHLLGDYAGVSSVAVITKSSRFAKNPNAATPSLMGLKGKRFVTMAESDQNDKLDEEAIKQLTGGEEITARGLYERSQISFKPQFTLWLSCNDLPTVRDKSLFASDRLRVIDFNRHFKPEERDKTLKDEFKTPEAMRGIFSWLVSGYYMYKRDGLNMPNSMHEVVKRYEKDNDVVLLFLEEKCERTEGQYIRKSNLYANYKIWCKTNGYYPGTAQRFNKAVEAHPEWFSDNMRNINGYTVYDGIRLK